MLNQCNFNIAWLGRCKNFSEKDMCQIHYGLKCFCCGAKAIKTCDYTGSASYVCGVLLCGNNECNHNIDGNWNH